MFSFRGHNLILEIQVYITIIALIRISIYIYVFIAIIFEAPVEVGDGIVEFRRWSGGGPTKVR